MSIKLLLVDDHAVVREGIKSLVEASDDIEIVGEAGNGEEAILKAAEANPDVVVMDVNLPEMNGIAATQRILSHSPYTSVLVLSTSRDKACVMAALKAGAIGFLGKDCHPRELVEGIRAVAAGRSYFCGRIKDLLLKDYTKRISTDSPDPVLPLSEREQVVLQHIASGRSTKETAFSLHVSVKTVETHRRRIMQKLGAHNTAELVRHAIREGLVSTW
ncbi:response regulator transcription factor [Geomonas sp. RF6]|uniref:response regulator transcription factor n=1 Tax=Geomonas sp. RF6 TaxID=2897342 RepID=UPI001E36DEAE|nr:response regulator transcription factor [Geomonas sp. RF6]UFS68882.1 response regulator transcription factor [Geomonas sp. RF6]